ncbi:MAG: hypothetical protein M3R51_08005 [Candidatus Eremiobacteraeota bacterium]|nr:hypothetical protein [Candidatus Eremiobacteraeota bacterium]
MDTHSRTKRRYRVDGEGTPSSPHSTDEALRYTTDGPRDVYFHPEDLVGHTERTSRHGT